MLSKILKNLLLIIFVATFQISFISNSMWPIFLIELILITVILTSELKSFKVSLIYSFILGGIFDLFGPLFFLSSVIGLLIVLFISKKLSAKFFTNQSVYSIIILMVIATISYKIIFLAMIFCNNLMFSQELGLQFFFNSRYWIHSGESAVINAFIAAIIYLIFENFMRKFKHQSLTAVKK